MPHVSYLDLFHLCPWPECGFQMVMIDFCLENGSNPALYQRAVSEWNLRPDYGLVARCPGCRQFVWFGKDAKRAVADPPTSDLEVLPDDWHLIAFIA